MIRKIQGFIFIFTIMLSVSVIMQGCESGGSRHARKQALLEESAKVTNVSGGEILQANMPYEKAYDNVLNFLKRQGYTFESASKDIGQIVTAMAITGGVETNRHESSDYTNQG